MPVPSRRARKTSELPRPLRSDVNTMLRPSGENLALYSNTKSFRNLRSFAPSASAIKSSDVEGPIRFINSTPFFRVPPEVAGGAFWASVGLARSASRAAADVSISVLRSIIGNLRSVLVQSDWQRHASTIPVDDLTKVRQWRHALLSGWRAISQLIHRLRRRDPRIPLCSSRQPAPPPRPPRASALDREIRKRCFSSPAWRRSCLPHRNWPIVPPRTAGERPVTSFRHKLCLTTGCTP